MNIEQRNAMVISNLPLVRSAASRATSFGMDYDDRYSIGCATMIKAVETHFPDQSSFSTYFHRSFRNNLLSAVQRQRNPRSVVSMDATTTNGDDSEMTLHDVVAAVGESALDAVIIRESIREMKTALSKLSPIHRYVLRLRYLDNGGTTQRGVATILNKSNAWVARREREALNACRSMIAC